MPCEVCKDVARIEVDKHIFCPKCYESYYYKQPSGCLDWKPYNDKSTVKKSEIKQIDLWDSILNLK